ncbi:MAG: hypothetical protein WC887_01930 [Candidatus Paceibacterota bacterium]|jgi:hypothetical protein
MKRFLSISIIALALFVGAAGVAPSVGYAQETAPAADAKSAVDAGKNLPAPVDNPTIAAQQGQDSAYNGVMIQIMKLFAWLVGVAALTLDYAVYYTVVTMGNYIHNLSAVGVAWRILRDVGNIMLIFGFLAIGISVILDTNAYGYGTKMLPGLLAAAIFLNFSLFITEAVIDGGNLVATQFYTQINGGALPTVSPSGGLITASGAPLTTGNEGISNKIMGQLRLQNIYNAGDLSTEIFKGGNMWLIGFMGIILFLITAFVLFSLAFILIVRFIILVFVIILAPIGFAGYAIPKLSGLSKQWSGELVKQTITAPILLLMLYVALVVITDAKFLTGFDTGANASGPSWLGFINNGNLGGFAGMLLSFLVAMGLLLSVVVLSKKLGAFGAAGAIKLGGMASFGAVSLGGRAVLGSAGNALAGKRMQSWARKNVALRPLVLAGKGLRSSTFDFRNAPGAGKALGALGINAGKGATFTAKRAHEADYGLKPVKGWLQEGEEERQKLGREMDFKDAQGAIEREKAKLKAGTITQAQYDANVAPYEKTITNTLSKMSTKQLEELGGIKNGVDALVTNLSPQQFESLMKSDKLSESEKGEIKKTRYQALNNTISGGNTVEIKKAIGALSKGELESMPTEMLAKPEVLNNLSDKQRDTITDSKERTAAEKSAVRNASPVGTVEQIFNTAGRGAAGAAAVVADPSFAKLTVPQIAKLDKDMLVEYAVAEKLTTATLIELQDQKKLKPADMITIGNHIRWSPTANQKTKDYVTNGPGAALWS